MSSETDVSLWIEHLSATRSCQVCGVGYSPGRYGEHATGHQHRNALLDNCRNRRADKRRVMAAPASESGLIAIEDGSHEPAADDFGNQYLARKDVDDICHNCGQKMVVAKPAR